MYDKEAIMAGVHCRIEGRIDVQNYTLTSQRIEAKKYKISQKCIWLEILNPKLQELEV